VIAPDPEFSGQSALLERRLEHAARSLEAEDLDSLLGKIGREMFVLYSEAVGADSMSIWLLDPGKTKLVVAYTEPDPAFVGWEQPLNEGLISLVVASEQALCENLVYQHTQHSKRADKAMDQITCSMIAVPFYLAGDLIGAVSCVQLKQSPGDPDPDGFTGRHLNRISRLSAALERMINYRLLVSLLDLEL